MARQIPKILLVEDSDSDALLIEQAFRKAGVANAFVRVGNGQAALHFLAQTSDQEECEARPLFVLLDLKLPDVSGYDLLRWIREQNDFSDLPVVVVTGSEVPDEQTRSQLAGATAFYRKHLSFEKLVDLVRSTGTYWSLVTAQV